MVWGAELLTDSKVEELLRRVYETVQQLHRKPNVHHLSDDELRSESEKFGIRTKYGSYNFTSAVKNRSAWLTIYVGSKAVRQLKLNELQRRLIRSLPKTVDAVHSYLVKGPFVCVERVMGDNDFFTPYCTLYLSVNRKDSIRLAYMFSRMLFPPKGKVKRPKLYLVDIPEWHEKDRQIIVFPEIGVTYVLGSDYYGEIKKGFLRMAMWLAKQKNMLGLHSGAKLVRVRDARTGELKNYSVLMLGLTATGKTTHTCHHHFLNDQDGESVKIVQDDVVFLRMDGSVLGTERGFYLKTEGLDASTQPVIYNVALKPNTIFENVLVDYKGEVHFEDLTLTGNGRAILLRDDMDEKYRSPTINMPPLSKLDGMIIIFITRCNTVVPIISKLSIEQAAAFFMLGESIETSGSDPRRAGQSVREVGMNPFIIGDPADEGNWFYSFLERNKSKIRCFLLNTGGVGEISEVVGSRRIVKQPVLRIDIRETAIIIRSILRDSVEWVDDPWFGTQVSSKIEGVDIEKFNPEKYYSKPLLEKFVERLRAERAKWLSRFKTLNPAMLKAFK